MTIAQRDLPNTMNLAATAVAAVTAVWRYGAHRRAAALGGGTALVTRDSYELQART